MEPKSFPAESVSRVAFCFSKRKTKKFTAPATDRLPPRKTPREKDNPRSARAKTTDFALEVWVEREPSWVAPPAGLAHAPFRSTRTEGRRRSPQAEPGNRLAHSGRKGACQGEVWFGQPEGTFVRNWIRVAAWTIEARVCAGSRPTAGSSAQISSLVCACERGGGTPVWAAHSQAGGQGACRPSNSLREDCRR